jgi:transcriptional regulator with XRE-family HTH domain
MPAGIDDAYARAIGQRIAEARRSRGLTQEDLRRRVGNSKNAVSNWERGVSAPTIQNLRELCEALAVAPQDLLLMNGGSPKPTESATEPGAKDLLQKLTALRHQAERAFPDLLTALKAAEDEARRQVERRDAS